MNHPFNIRTKIKDLAAGKMSILILLFFLSISCEKEHGEKDYNPPSDHTISKDGYMHRSGLKQPLDNCVNCHGSDLNGGSSGVSCYECHGKEW